MAKILKMFGIAILLIWGGVFVVTLAWVYFMVSAHNASRSFEYSPGIFGTGIFESPGDRFKLTCWWKDMIEGPCDKKDSYGLLNKEEIAWIMEEKKVSKEDIIQYANQYIEYRRGQIKKYDVKNGEIIPEAYFMQIVRLENIIKILEEE